MISPISAIPAHNTPDVLRLLYDFAALLDVENSKQQIASLREMRNTIDLSTKHLDLVSLPPRFDLTAIVKVLIFLVPLCQKQESSRCQESL